MTLIEAMQANLDFWEATFCVWIDALDGTETDAELEELRINILRTQQHCDVDGVTAPPHYDLTGSPIDVCDPDKPLSDYYKAIALCGRALKRCLRGDPSPTKTECIDLLREIKRNLFTNGKWKQLIIDESGDV